MLTLPAEIEAALKAAPRKQVDKVLVAGLLGLLVLDALLFYVGYLLLMGVYHLFV